MYHNEAAVNAYLQTKKEHPDGYLWRKYGKERLRTMYKNDKQLKIDGELANKPAKPKKI